MNLLVEGFGVSWPVNENDLASSLELSTATLAPPVYKGRPRRLRQFDGGEFLIAYFDQGQQEGQAREILTPHGLRLIFEYDGKNRVKKVRCGDAYCIEYTFNDRDRLIGLRQLALNR